MVKKKVVKNILICRLCKVADAQSSPPSVYCEPCQGKLARGEAQSVFK